MNRVPIISSSAVRRALAWYVAWSITALVAVSVGVVLLGGLVARHEALRDAERTARAVAYGIVAPLADERFHARDPAALAGLTEALALRTLDGSISHVKIWADAGPGAGTILWANNSQLVGRTYPMDAEVYALFGGTEVVAEVSDLDKEENELERAEGNLVEVYAGMRDAAGEHLLFEAYLSTVALTEDTRALALEILPLPLGALLVLTLATLPLAVSLARRVDGSQAQMRRLLVNAVAASDLERRRIAQELHDGVLQDLAGVGYSLSSDARALAEGSDVQRHIDQARLILRDDVTALRHLVADIYPPDLETEGLATALRELIDAQDFGQAELSHQIDDSLAPSPLAARLAYRVARELLSNVASHAQASHIAIRMTQEGDQLDLTVADDGVGFTPSAQGPEGHFGLRLLQETVADAGGSLSIESAPGQGTTVQVRLPI